MEHVLVKWSIWLSNGAAQQNGACDGEMEHISKMEHLDTKTNLQNIKNFENGRKTPQPFSTSTFEYENESGKAGYENKLTEYQEFRKRTNSSGIMSNIVGI